MSEGNGVVPGGIDTLPDGWSVVPFDDVIEFVSGQVDPRQEPYSKMPHVGPENIEERTGRIINTQVAEDLRLISGKYLFGPEHVLYSKIRPYLRKAALPSFVGICSADMYPLKPKNSSLAREFLFMWLLSEAFTQQAVSFQDRTGIPKINRTQLQSTRLVLPPLPEQKAIARVLRALQQAKEATEQVVAATRQLKKSLMRHLFAYGQVPFDQADRVALKETEGGPVPEHWEVVRLVELLREPLRNGHSATATNTDQGIRTLTLTAVTQNDFSVQNTKLTSADPDRVRGMWLKSGDIFIERANTPEYVGLAALYEGDEDFAIFPDLLVRVRVQPARLDPKFLAEFLLTEPCRNYYRTSAKATTGNFPKIDQGTIERTAITLPPMAEQVRIVEAARRIDAKIKAESSRKMALDALFQTLLDNLMTGKVRVHDVPAYSCGDGECRR
jgi:type I restriction enzyme S subunit